MNKSIKIIDEADGLQFIEIDNSLAVGRVALQGGHVDWWRPKSAKQDVLWRSSNARYEKGRSIRGGVPICWPWFGKHPTDGSFCAHGFARVIPWKLLESVQLKNGATKIVLTMIPTEAVTKQLTYSFELILTIVVGESLYLNLETTNLSDSPFVISEGYHTYFYISDIKNIKVTGLENSIYTDKIDNFGSGIEKKPITFNNEFDRVYTNSNDCYIEDEKFNTSEHKRLVLMQSSDLLPVVFAAISETTTSIFLPKNSSIFFFVFPFFFSLEMIFFASLLLS